MKCLECDKYTVVMWHWIDYAPLIDLSVYIWQECGAIVRRTCTYMMYITHLTIN